YTHSKEHLSPGQVITNNNLAKVLMAIVPKLQPHNFSSNPDKIYKDYARFCRYEKTDKSITIISATLFDDDIFVSANNKVAPRLTA
ncbi:MAG: hypothetical protein JHC33_08595, partial [Ignisphaera sp.]|nr:hypothetical protein [Ignisphaera sp.]